MSTRNPNQLAPSPFPDGDRRTNVAERVIARPADGRDNWSGPDVRQGHRQAEEGLAGRPDIAAGTLRGLTDAYAARPVYERQRAVGRVRLGAMNPAPEWDRVRPLDGHEFGAGVVSSRVATDQDPRHRDLPARPTERQRSVRSAASNPNGLSPVPDFVERPRQSYDVVIGGNRERYRRNAARIED